MFERQSLGRTGHCSGSRPLNPAKEHRDLEVEPADTSTKEDRGGVTYYTNRATSSDPHTSDTHGP